MIKTIYKCDCCGREFYTYDGEFGLVVHEHLYAHRDKLSKNLKLLCLEIVTVEEKDSILGVRLRYEPASNDLLDCVLQWETLSEKDKEKVKVYSKRLYENVKERRASLNKLLDDFKAESSELIARVWEGIDE